MDITLYQIGTFDRLHQLFSFYFVAIFFFREKKKKKERVFFPF